MKNQHENILSSISMIESSIRTDRQVFQWFDMLVTRLEVRKLLGSEEGFDNIYKELHKNFIKSSFLLGLLITSMLFGLYSEYLSLWGIAIASFFGFLWLRNSRKSYVARIAGVLISSQVREHDHKTLFQVCEILSRQYHVSSLTDSMSWADNLERRFIIGTFFFVFLIVPFSFQWAVVVLVLSNIFLSTIILRHPMILRFIK